MTQTEWRKIFGDNLASLLQENKMTQAQLAKDSGLSKSRINDYIKGYATPSIFAIINMANALCIDITEFVDFEDVIEC